MIKLYVTEANIRNGWHSDGCRCPIALAAKDAGLTNVQVGPVFIHFGEGDTHHSARLPPEAVEWERNYDIGQPMTPITFDIQPFPTAVVCR